jgi:cell division protein FtsQ
VAQKLGCGLAVLLVMVGGFVALYLSDFLPVTEVAVVGNDKLNTEYVIGLAEVPEDSTFLRTDAAGITARLLAEPWIQSVEVERGFPGVLTLRITEQPVAAVVDIVPETANDTTQRWVIAADGTWIAQLANNDAEGAASGAASQATGEAGGAAEASQTEGEAEAGAAVEGSPEGAALGTESQAASSGVRVDPAEFVKIPVIRDVSAAVRPVSGEKETDEGITNALALLTGFSEDMRAMVASISAPNAVKTRLTLYNNVGVAFGTAEDIQAKEQAIATLLAEHEGAITSINVRVADRATYRPAPQ